MNSAVLLLVERPGPDIDALIEGLEAGGLTAIYRIAIENQPEAGAAGSRLAISPSGSSGQSVCGSLRVAGNLRPE